MLQLRWHGNVTCPSCGGRGGTFHPSRGSMQFSPCGVCGGRKQITCPVCRGNREINGSYVLPVAPPPLPRQEQAPPPLPGQEQARAQFKDAHALAATILELDGLTGAETEVAERVLHGPSCSVADMARLRAIALNHSSLLIRGQDIGNSLAKTTLKQPVDGVIFFRCRRDD